MTPGGSQNRRLGGGRARLRGRMFIARKEKADVEGDVAGHQNAERDLLHRGTGGGKKKGVCVGQLHEIQKTKRRVTRQGLWTGGRGKKKPDILRRTNIPSLRTEEGEVLGRRDFLFRLLIERRTREKRHHTGKNMAASHIQGVHLKHASQGGGRAERLCNHRLRLRKGKKETCAGGKGARGGCLWGEPLQAKGAQGRLLAGKKRRNRRGKAAAGLTKKRKV